MLTWNKNIEKEKLPVSTAGRFCNRTNLQLNSYGNITVRIPWTSARRLAEKSTFLSETCFFSSIKTIL